MKRHKVNICGEPLRAPVDVKNDAMMVREHLRHKPLILNKEIFKKTESEKILLKKMKHKKKFSNSIRREPSGKPRYPKRFIVHVTNPKKDKNFKTTYVFHCVDKEELSNIIDAAGLKRQEIKEIKSS